MEDRRTKDGGFALVTTTVIIAILLLSGISLMNYTVSVRKVGKSVEDEFNAIQLAEAGIQKTLFCLNATSGTECGGTYGSSYAGETDVDLDNGTFTTTLTGTGTNRTITSVGTTPSGVSKTILSEVTTEPVSEDASFSYALQAGQSGAYLENNAVITGSLYSNGDITCQTPAAIIDGDAYVATSAGSVNACSVNYDAHADSVLDSVVTGDAYYDADPAGIAGSVVTGVKYPGSPTPVPADLPDINLDWWRAEAEAGGSILGDYSPSDGESLGPVKIIGDLNVGIGIDLTVTGTIWVVGNVITGNNATFTLDSSFGQYGSLIMADNPGDPVNDGKIDITNGVGIFGSGDPRSHVMFLSTNTSENATSPALRVANNAAGAVFLATEGVLKLGQNAGAKSLAAKKLYISQNAIITFVESELADAKFSNGPGGRWRLLTAGWREQK